MLSHFLDITKNLYHSVSALQNIQADYAVGEYLLLNVLKVIYV